MRKLTWYAMLPARNCISDIERVVESLASQRLPCGRINVIDDGSTDGTGQMLDRLAERYKILNVVHKDSKTRDYSRLPKWWNEMLEKDHYDYFMITAGDIVFENDYAEKILTSMNKNPKCVIASGRIINNQVLPSGAGRFVKSEWFFKHYDRFPEIVGYESEMMERASMDGQVMKVFRDCHIEHTVETGHGHSFSEFGSGMRSLGYYPPFAIARCILAPLQGRMPIRGALNMLWYYLKFRQDGRYYSLFDAELRNHVREKQKDAILKRLMGRRFEQNM